MARLRGNSWQADIRVNGKRVRHTFTSKSEAEAWEKTALYNAERGLEVPVPTKSSNGTSESLKSFTDTHFNHLWGNNKSAEKSASNLRLVMDVLGPDIPLTDLNYGTLLKLTSRLQDAGNSNSTINRKLAVLSKLLRHAHKLGLIVSVPEIPRFRETLGRIRFFTAAEMDALLQEFKHLGLMDAYHYTRFLLYTGCRRSEALSVQRQDVTKSVVTFWDTKNGKPRSIPITPPVAEALSHFDGPKVMDAYPFDTFTAHWNRVRERLGYLDDPAYVPHTLRHTCASRLVQAGIDLRRVQVYMGHSSIQTTLRYAHLAPTDLEVAAKALL